MQLENTINHAFEEGITSVLISAPKNTSQVRKISIRQFEMKGGLKYQASSYLSDNKVIHRNLTKEECRPFILHALESSFKQAILETAKGSYHVTMAKKGPIIKKKARPGLIHVAPHNRTKNYILEDGTRIPFLIELGVMSQEGKVRASMMHKFKQINRFLEIVRDVIPVLKEREKIRVLDFGCGKAYLTFALYYYLRKVLQLDVEMVGVDLKEDVVAFCQSLAKKLRYQDLQFIAGDIRSYNGLKKIDLMVALHACDTATDVALEKGIDLSAEAILLAPCCQHELFSKIQSKDLLPLLQHGILKERFAALATDALRGKRLEAAGYFVQIMEFIDMEHTPKNILIRATKSQKPNPNAHAEYKAFKNYLLVF